MSPPQQDDPCIFLSCCFVEMIIMLWASQFYWSQIHQGTSVISNHHCFLSALTTSNLKRVTRGVGMTDDQPPEHTNCDTITNTNCSNPRHEDGDVVMTKCARSSSTDFIQTSSGERLPKIDWRDLPLNVQRTIISNPDGLLQKTIPSLVCDACPHCNDTCELEECPSCVIKREETRTYNNTSKNQTYSICQTRRHRNLASCWIVVDSSIYNATPYLEKHPGGVTSILRHSGGTNCSTHFYFHSVRGKKKWKGCIIGKLVYCEGGKHHRHSPPATKQGCAIS